MQLPRILLNTRDFTPLLSSFVFSKRLELGRIYRPPVINPRYPDKMGDKPLCLLALGERYVWSLATVARVTNSYLDGGGIRGLSKLLILEQIMERIKYDLDMADDPLPADFFDLIGGTSTGG